MNIGELFKTKRWKTFMGYVYGWGAAIVLLGSLFKMQHWPYSGALLAIGLFTEALIFFLSAFEPPLDMPEWSKVYPELRDDYEPMELESHSKRGNTGMGQILATPELSPELIDKVGKSLDNLSSVAHGISDISSATLATDMYVKNLSSASESMNSLAEMNKKANRTVNSSIQKLAESYSFASQHISNTGKNSVDKLNKSSEEFSLKLTETGQRLVETVNGASGSFSSELETIGKSSKIYSTNLERLNENISSLNKNFESQLEGTKTQVEANLKFSNDIKKMNEILESSVSELQKYKMNAEQLNEHLEALNTIYGNMLGALSYKK